nr:MAG TPA: hypothetical protein [Caudoviricetes sp.]
MYLTIKLKDGEYIGIENLTLIKQHESTYLNAVDIVDFSNFKLYDTQYTFVGDSTLLLHAQDIVYLTFKDN